MGKGKRSGRSTYRRVKHSAAYYKRKREFEARKKAIKNGEIYTGEMKVVIPLLPHSITDLLNATKKGVKS